MPPAWPRAAVSCSRDEPPIPTPGASASATPLPATTYRSLLRLAEGADLEQQGPVSLWLLGQSLAVLGDRDRALAMLQRARRAYPDDFWLNLELGLTFLGGQRLGPTASGVLVTAPLDDRESKQHPAEPYLMAAVALRPRFAPAHHAPRDGLRPSGPVGRGADRVASGARRSNPTTPRSPTPSAMS